MIWQLQKLILADAAQWTVWDSRRAEGWAVQNIFQSSLLDVGWHKLKVDAVTNTVEAERMGKTLAARVPKDTSACM